MVDYGKSLYRHKQEMNGKEEITVESFKLNTSFMKT